MAKFGYFASGSSLALALTLGLAGTAAAQPAPAPAEDEEDIVITGSFIRGTPEDAAIPVRAMTLQDLQNMGTPSNLDLVKNMVDSGSVRGEGDRRGAGSSVGVQTINLRQLGSARTLVLLNGRRLQDQSSAGLRFANTAVIPNNAIGRVDTLRDGGAVRYGSDAIGGVVNFITRHDFSGLQARTNYRFVEGSDGDYDADVLWGSSVDNGNIMVAAQFQHRSSILATDRDWTDKHYLQNDSTVAWAATGSPGSYTFLQSRNAATGALATAVTPGTLPAAAVNDYRRQMSSTGVFRDPGCRTELGLFAGWSSTPSPICYNSLIPNNKVAEESDTYNVYTEANFDFDNGLRYHGEAVYYQLQVPEGINTPSEAPSSVPAAVFTCTGAGTGTGINRYTGALVNNGAVGASCTAGNVGQQVQISQGAFHVPGHNPAVTDLMARFTTQDGAAGLSGAQQTAISTAGGVALTSWRPFSIGGNPFTGGNDSQKNRLDQFRTTQELSGDLPKFFGTDLRWTADFTGIHTVFKIDAKDISVARMQAALDGYGGASCDKQPSVPGFQLNTTGTTPSVAGAGDCQYFNPFSSAIARNVFTGQSNAPGDGGTFVGTGTYAGYTPGQGLQNNYALSTWLWEPIKFERDYTSAEVNFAVNGDLPIELPGGPIAVAFGGQYRYVKELFMVSANANQDQFGCTLGTNCTFTAAPLFNRAAQVFAQPRNRDRWFPAWATFGEVQFPILDSLTANASVRYEKFVSDTGNVNNSVVAPQGSVRWQVTDWLALRGTAGSTFANVTPPENLPPAVANSLTNNAYGVGSPGASGYQTVNAPNFAVSPERGYNYNIGALFKAGPLSFNIDYYNIKIDGLAVNVSAADIFNALAVDPSVASSASLVNCSSFALTQPQAGLGGLPFVTLDDGITCTQGVTTFAMAFNNPTGNDGAVVRFYGLPRNVNGGTFQTDGIDIASSLTFDDVVGGRLVLSLDGTHVLNWDMGKFEFGGNTISNAYDGVGSFNLNGTKANGETVFEYRANAGANFNIGPHNFNWRTTWTSAVEVDTGASLATRTAGRNANYGLIDGNAIDAAAASCTGATPPTFSENTSVAGVGQGQFGTLSGGAIGYCSALNSSLTGGTTELPASFYSDFTYRVRLPLETTATLTVQNVFDRDPGFTRTAVSYNSFMESPTGRTFRIGVEKKF